MDQGDKPGDRDCDPGGEERLQSRSNGEGAEDGELFPPGEGKARDFSDSAVRILAVSENR